MTPLRILHRIEELLLVFLVTCLLVLTCGQIILRNLFSISFIGIESLVRHLVLWLGLAGALLATRMDKHIRIDAALRLLPPKARALALSFADILTTGICGLLAFVAWRFAMDEREYGGMAFFSFPAWIAQLCFPLVFGLMALRFLYQAWTHFKRPSA